MEVPSVVQSKGYFFQSQTNKTLFVFHHQYLKTNKENLILLFPCGVQRYYWIATFLSEAPAFSVMIYEAALEELQTARTGRRIHEADMDVKGDEVHFY